MLTPRENPYYHTAGSVPASLRLGDIHRQPVQVPEVPGHPEGGPVPDLRPAAQRAKERWWEIYFLGLWW